MVPVLCLQTELSGDDEGDKTSVLDLNLSAMGGYHFSFLPLLETGFSTWSEPSLDEPRKHKRLKQEALSADESIVRNTCLYSGSNSWSTDSFPRLLFRDHVWTYTQRYLAVEAMEEATFAMIGGLENEAKEEGLGDGTKQVQQLIACAEAVACRDKIHASALLSELRANALVFGTSFQRVASCFVQGLSDRLALVQPAGAIGAVCPAENTIADTLDKEEALSLVYEICPHIQFSHFVANASMLEAFEGESSVHVVDLGMTLALPHGHQWRWLIHSLASRAGHRPKGLRITGVGNSAERLRVIGDELELCAQTLGLNLEFLVVESNLENLKPQDFHIRDGEVVVINSILQMHCTVKESRGALNSFLQILHELSPKLLILVEQDSSHNGPFFLGRFHGGTALLFCYIRLPRCNAGQV